MRTALPIDPHVDRIVATTRRFGSAIVVAPPGAGKTTRVPPALVADGPVLLLQPRRLAARALARRIASEQDWSLGDEVGWQVRFEHHASQRTRLLVATEGILTARLQADPLLLDFRTVVLDEFHERSIHADLALALVKQAALARGGDLRVVVMSATLDAVPVSDYLAAPIIEVEGRAHPIEIRYAPRASAAEATREVLAGPGGHLLVFLPGAPEIRRLGEELGRSVPLVVPLHGSLDAEQQDAALASSPGRKVVLATNIAETSLTVEGVTTVIDTGQHKVMRQDPSIGLDRLQLERISRDAADQRAGRAGRTGPGVAIRLWDQRDELRPHREPEIHRTDLATPFLEVLAWGGDPLRFDWFEAPEAERATRALELLALLGAVEAGRITALGRLLHRFPLHPRLARVLASEGGSAEAVAACAILAEGWRPREPLPASDCDLLVLADRLTAAPHGVRRAAEAIGHIARNVLGSPGAGEPLRRALLAAYPDRVGQRREPGSRRLVLASGHGAQLARESGVLEGEFLLALDAEGSTDRSRPAEALVRIAARIERPWLAPTRTTFEHVLDEDSGEVRAYRRSYYGEILLASAAAPAEPDAAECLLLEAMERRATQDEAGQRCLRRLRFAGIDVDLASLLRDACRGRTRLPAGTLETHLRPETTRILDRLAPEWLDVPSGRRVRLSYREDGVAAAVKLQELFGLAESPRLGPGAQPVLFELLAPNGRPVQATRDLRSFWEKTYPLVRKELRGRYPKHPWPEDPWTAPPTHRAKPRARKP